MIFTEEMYSKKVLEVFDGNFYPAGLSNLIKFENFKTTRPRTINPFNCRLITLKKEPPRINEPINPLFPILSCLLFFTGSGSSSSSFANLAPPRCLTADFYGRICNFKLARTHPEHCEISREAAASFYSLRYAPESNRDASLFRVRGDLSRRRNLRLTWKCVIPYLHTRNTSEEAINFDQHLLDLVLQRFIAFTW